MYRGVTKRGLRHDMEVCMYVRMASHAQVCLDGCRRMTNSGPPSLGQCCGVQCMSNRAADARSSAPMCTPAWTRNHSQPDRKKQKRESAAGSGAINRLPEPHQQQSIISSAEVCHDQEAVTSTSKQQPCQPRLSSAASPADHATLPVEVEVGPCEKAQAARSGAEASAAGDEAAWDASCCWAQQASVVQPSAEPQASSLHTRTADRQIAQSTPNGLLQPDGEMWQQSLICISFGSVGQMGLLSDAADLALLLLTTLNLLQQPAILLTGTLLPPCPWSPRQGSTPCLHGNAPFSCPR